MAKAVTRREVLAAAAQVAVIGAFASPKVSAQSGREFCLFSKHLPELAWSDLGKAVKDVYDMVVFLPLKVEELIVDARARVRLDESATDRTASRA